MFDLSYTYKQPKVLLTTDNAKTIKGEDLGYKTLICYMSPHKQNAFGRNLCPKATAGCMASCLFTAGRGAFSNVKIGRLRKSEFFLSNKELFMEQLVTEIEKAVRNKKDKNICVRLNGTTDIPFENIKVGGFDNIMSMFPSIQFYDYTKVFARLKKELPKNYHLTFSMSEDNREIAFDLLSKGVNVAMVFNIKNSNELPKTYKGYEVINGDNDDLTFLHPKGIILGLKYKKLTGKGASIKNKEALKSDFIINLDESYTLV
jgi:hypothetical protein